jgi:hypothetical protein
MNVITINPQKTGDRSQNGGWCGLHTTSIQDPGQPNRKGNISWIPACAGMTGLVGSP